MSSFIFFMIVMIEFFNKKGNNKNYFNKINDE